MVEFGQGRPEVMHLLGGDYRNKDVRKSAAQRRAGWRRPTGLGPALRASYCDLPISPQLDASLMALDHPDTLAIVTGQQIGLFGGPLFTFYKALHTVLLAHKLRADAPGAVVPMFWMETADADFGEVNRIAFPATPDGHRRAVYTPEDVVVGRSISLHVLQDEISAVRSEVDSWLTGSRFGAPLTDLLHDAYAPGRLMPDAFRQLFNQLLGEMGLILVDARHPALIPLGKDFWQTALAHPERLNDPFKVSSQELEQARLPLQVQLRRDALPVMKIGEDGVRRRILGQQNAWKIGNEGAEFNDIGLARLVRDEAESLTPSALLRPLFQDWLLPTWLYIGGPAEVSYHAQIGRAYDAFNLPRPLIAPRLSLTLIERPMRRSLEKHGWSVADVIGGREIMLRRSGESASMQALFEGGSDHIQSWLKRIEKAGDELGMTLYEEIDQAARKIEHQWNRLRQIALYKLSEQDKSRVLHAERLLDRITPDGLLQERQFSVLYFLSQYGASLTKIISEEVDILAGQHTAIDIEVEE
jgi:bacillithiol biosynthesis cysteine-adding enzyme BshC